MSKNQNVNIGDLGFYTTGFTIPPGHYCIYFDVRLYSFKNKQGISTGDPTLGVMGACYNLEDPAAEPREQFWSMGKNAHKSFMPNPETGKGVIPVANPESQGLPSGTDWAEFLHSLYNSSLPPGVFTNDFTALDGIRVVTNNVPESEERQQFKKSKQIAEVQTATNKGPKMIPIVVSIDDDGKPWENTGGLPEAAAPKKVAVAPARPAAPGRPAPRAAAPRPAPAPVAAAVDGDAIRDAALNAVGDVLSAKANAAGMKKVKMRVDTLSKINAAYPDGKMAEDVVEAFFGSEGDLNGLLSEIGYGIVGVDVKPLT